MAIGNAGTYTRNEIADIPQRPDQYPNYLWSSQTSRYAEYWDYYDGTILDEDVEGGKTETNDPLKKYPLKINLAKLSVQKHSFALLGEYDKAAVIDFHAVPRGKDDQTATLIDEFLYKVWRENKAVGLLPEQARIAYVCGGCVFKLAADPTKKSKIRIEIILPDYFFPVWDSTDYHHLLEVEIAYTISTREAVLKYGFQPDAMTGDEALYKERWTEDEYEVTIGGQLITNSLTGEPYQGKNPFIDPDTGRGIIPFEYFPIDRTGSFYGTSIIEQIMGLQDEYNCRLADIGDAVNEGVHPYRYGRNLPKAIKEIKLSRFTIKNLGMNPPNQNPPEINYVQHPGVPKGTIEFLAQLLEDFRSVSNTPGVSYGIDEGSQRSALTLAFRMWPITTVVRDTRGQWDASFSSMNRKIIIMSIIKGGEAQPTWLGYEVETKWAPIIPRDREQLVSEQVLLTQAKLRSPETAIKTLGECDDIETEIERIVEWQKKMAELLQPQLGKGKGAPTMIETPIAKGIVE